MPLNLMPALRDAVGDLANWRKSPLRPLLDKAAGDIDRERLQEFAEGVFEATSAIAGCDEVRAVGDLISNKLVEMVGSLHALEMCLGFSPSDGERLIRTLRLFIDLGKQHGLFLTDDTFEVALYRSGRSSSFARTMSQLSSNAAAKGRANAGKTNPSSLDVNRMLADIEAIGKGRFSQRWALHVNRSNSKHCPASVREALEYVANRIQSRTLPGGSGGATSES